MENPFYIEARQIEPGDFVTLATGDKLEVRSVSKGMLPGHVNLDLVGGSWSEVPRTEMVQIDRPAVEVEG